MIKIFEKVSFDTDANTCYFKIAEGEIFDSIETQKDCWVDLNKEGLKIGIEILNTDKNLTLIKKILLSNAPIAECV